MDSPTMFNIFIGLLIFQVVSAIGIFILLFFINAPYGKYVSKKFGPTIGPRVGWVLMELPAFIIILLFFVLGLINGVFNDGRSVVVMVIFLLIWESHYIHRTFVYPFLMSKKAKRMPLVIPIFGISFNVINGFINGFYLFGGKTVYFENTIFEVNLAHLYTIEWLYDPRFIIGVLIFFIGIAINIHSDHVLRTLRKPGETAYKVPNRGMHKLLANPNYFGELMEWVGFAVLTWSLPALAFVLFTFANLAPRAWNNRKWYREQFGDSYPKSRRAIIPFIF